MDSTTSMIELIVTIIVSIAVLYTSVITYRLPVAGIIGVNVLLGVIIAVIHHYTVSNVLLFPAGPPSSAVIAEEIVLFGISIASLVATFYILMTRFSFLGSLGIVIVQMAVTGVINYLLGLYRVSIQTHPSAKPPANRPMYRS